MIYLYKPQKNYYFKDLNDSNYVRIVHIKERGARKFSSLKKAREFQNSHDYIKGFEEFKAVSKVGLKPREVNYLKNYLHFDLITEIYDVIKSHEKRALKILCRHFNSENKKSKVCGI